MTLKWKKNQENLWHLWNASNNDHLWTNMHDNAVSFSTAAELMCKDKKLTFTLRPRIEKSPFISNDTTGTKCQNVGVYQMRAYPYMLYTPSWYCQQNNIRIIWFLFIYDLFAVFLSPRSLLTVLNFSCFAGWLNEFISTTAKHTFSKLFEKSSKY